MNKEIIDLAKMNMEDSLTSLDKRFNNVRAGRANPSSLDGITVDYYGSMTPLKQLATISVPEATQLLIKPFDKSCLKDIVRAINEADLGIDPTDNGESVIMSTPPLTEERRKEYVKQAKEIAEETKIALRKVRQEANDEIKEDESIPEDEEKVLLEEVQKLINDYNKKVEEKLKEKEKELMTI